MNTRYKKHLEAFKNTVVSVVSSGERCKSHGIYSSRGCQGGVKSCADVKIGGLADEAGCDGVK